MTPVALLIAGWLSAPQSAPPPAGAPADESVRQAALAAHLNAMGAPQSQEDFERDELQKSGLPRLADIAAEGREVFQLSLNDPYFMFAVPAIQVEKSRDGATLTVFNRRGPVMTVPIDDADWNRIFDIELMRAPPQPRPAAVPDGPPPIVHSWIARLGRAGEGESVTRSASGDARAMGAAALAARLALGARPDCDQAADGEPFFAFHRCFAPRPA